MNGTALKATLPPRALNLPLGTLALALALAGVGALDTEAAGLGPRIGYWLIMTAVAVAGCYLVRLGVRRLRPTWSEIATGAVSAVLAAGPLTVAALAICIGLFGGEFTFERLRGVAPGVLTVVALVQAGLAASFAWPAVTVGIRPPGLDARLPLELSGAVIHALEAEDHYVRVHTDRGAALLRMRLGEAAALFARDEGLRVHRSWWIRGDAVASVRRSGRRVFVTLVNGREIPVSRTAARDLGNTLADWRWKASGQ